MSPADRIITRAVERLARGEKLTPEEREQVRAACDALTIGQKG